MPSFSRLIRFAAGASVFVTLTTEGRCSAPSAPRATAGRTSASIPSAGEQARPTPTDIALDDDRSLRGRFVDADGNPIDGAVVTLKQHEQTVARTTTRTDGTFQIDDVRTGAYRLSCGSSSGQVRCWTPGAAPPNAVVDGVTFKDSVVRGQAGLLAPAIAGTTLASGAAVTGVSVGGIAAYTATTSNHSSRSATTGSPTPHTNPTSVSDSRAAAFSPYARLTTEVAQTDRAGDFVFTDANGNTVRVPRNASAALPPAQSFPSSSSSIWAGDGVGDSHDVFKLPVSP